MKEKSVAFISHDSRDKASIARPLAQELTTLLGRVWFDEYSLNLGDNLRESIERGIRECQRCVLIITPNFLNNTGWTRTEFDAIFTREIVEKGKLILPIWCGVTQKEVYEYSPTLANRLAVQWDEGLENVAAKIQKAILSDLN